MNRDVSEKELNKPLIPSFSTAGNAMILSAVKEKENKKWDREQASESTKTRPETETKQSKACQKFQQITEKLTELNCVSSMFNIHAVIVCSINYDQNICDT